MTRWPAAKWGVLIITVLTVVFLVAVGQLAWALMTSDNLVAVIMGAVLVIFPVVGAALVVRDLMFALQGNRLLEQLAAAGDLPVDDLPRRPSGRVERAAADADFERWKQEVESAPGEWSRWVRLSLAYKAAGDSARARDAMRTAIRLERDARTGSTAADE